MSKTGDRLPPRDERMPMVGVVGETVVKYHPTANNRVVKVVEGDGCEAVVPDLTGFFLYSAYNRVARRKLGARPTGFYIAMEVAIRLIELYRLEPKKRLVASRRFSPPPDVRRLAKRAGSIISTGNCMGESWILTAEMLALIDEGVENIVCVQPVACLPNHVVGKGPIKEMKRRHPRNNIVAVDYGPGASGVNQLKRKCGCPIISGPGYRRSVYEQIDCPALKPCSLPIVDERYGLCSASLLQCLV